MSLASGQRPYLKSVGLLSDAAAKADLAVAVLKRHRADFFDRINQRYVQGLSWVFEHRVLTLISVAITTALTFLILFLMPKGFFPEQDTGLLQGISQGARHETGRDH